MSVTNYIYNPLTEAYLMEQDGDGNTTVVYTQEPVKYGDVIAQHRIDPATGVGESFYYHTDALGSTRELTDESGTVVATYNYDAFGNTIASTGTVENPFRFTGNVGYYWDEELQTYHIRARNYQPTTGRWTSQDPIGFAGGINLYGAYFVPFYTDPTGSKVGGTMQLEPPWEQNADEIQEWREKCLLRCLRWRVQLAGLTRECQDKCNRYAATPYIDQPRKMRKLIIGHGFLCRNPCPKPGRVMGYPGRTIPRGQTHVVDGGTYNKVPMPDPENWVTAAGASPCAIVVVACDDGVTRMHFGVRDSTESISLIVWGRNCKAIVCGGDNDRDSNCLHEDVIQKLKGAGIDVARVSPAQGCGVDGSGNWIESDDIEGMPE